MWVLRGGSFGLHQRRGGGGSQEIFCHTQNTQDNSCPASMMMVLMMMMILLSCHRTIQHDGNGQDMKTAPDSAFRTVPGDQHRDRACVKLQMRRSRAAAKNLIKIKNVLLHHSPATFSRLSDGVFMLTTLTVVHPPEPTFGWTSGLDLPLKPAKLPN